MFFGTSSAKFQGNRHLHGCRYVAWTANHRNRFILLAVAAALPTKLAILAQVRLIAHLFLW